MMIESRLSSDGFIPPSNLFKQSIREDVSSLCREDIRKLLISIVGDETAKQENLGNKAQMVYTDGFVNRPVTEAKKKVEVIFGDQLARVAMSLVSSTLAGAIARTTNTKTGNLKSSWEWIFLRNNAPIAFPSDSNGNLQFQNGDKLIYKPKGITYASIVNMKVASGSKALSVRTRKTKRNPTGVSKRNQSMGFMGATTAVLKRNPIFRNFRVFVAMTKNHQVAGEINKKQGTLCIVISPKYRRAK
jgi:hypothetical protein